VVNSLHRGFEHSRIKPNLSLSSFASGAQNQPQQAGQKLPLHRVQSNLRLDAYSFVLKPMKFPEVYFNSTQTRCLVAESERDWAVPAQSYKPPFFEADLSVRQGSKDIPSGDFKKDPSTQLPLVSMQPTRCLLKFLFHRLC
jgi:hypothetical protein